jgi:hypothetical protein
MNTDEASDLRRELHLAATQNVGNQIRFDQGVLDCLEALIDGLVQAGLVPSDFLISDLAERLKVWKEPTAEHPEGRIAQNLTQKGVASRRIA